MHEVTFLSKDVLVPPAHTETLAVLCVVAQCTFIWWLVYLGAVIVHTFELVSTGRVALQSTHSQSQSALMHMCGASSSML